MRNNRTDIDMKVRFEDGDKSGEEWIYIPYEIFMEVFPEYVYARKNVKIDGKANDIWNMLASSGFFEEFADNEPEFIETVRERYYNSPYYKEDKEDWIEDLEYEM